MVWIVAFAVLLLPVPISFLVPSAAGVSPDPWRVRRSRLAIGGFALTVAIGQIGLLLFTHSMIGGEWTEGVSVWGLLIWAPMVWLLLLFLILELRRPLSDPFPGQGRRAASLRPRHRLDTGDQRAWRVLGVLWLPIAAWVLLSASDRAVATVLLSAAALLFMFGPFLVRRGALAAEPLLLGHEEELGEAYAARRRLRARAGFAVLTVAVTWKTLLAAALGWRLDLSITFWLLGLAAFVLVVLMANIAVRDLRLVRRIRSIQADAAARAS